jgi:hypothetical protein
VFIKYLENPPPLQRLADRFGEHSTEIFSSIRLKTQYQSNRALVEWPNQVFYRGQIHTDSSVAAICLADLWHSNKAVEEHHEDILAAETRTAEQTAEVLELFQKTLVLIDTDLVG